MIYFFPMFSRHAGDTPYGEALRSIGVAHRIYSDKISFQYRTAFGLILVCIPQLVRFALRNAWISFVRDRPAPDAVVLSSDVEALIFAAARFVTGKRVARIVVTPFIYTTRSRRWANVLRRAYYGFVLRHVDLAIVHSRAEAARYREVFPRARATFVFVPYGLNIDERSQLLAAARAAPAHERPVVVTAGKSGRDYATLFRAVVGLDVEVRVICDFAPAVPPVPAGARVVVLGDCHGWDYLNELARADIVALPLALDDISAGQMCLIQAKALERAIIVTDTTTIRDYVTDGADAMLVARGDAAAMRAMIERLAGDAGLRARLGQTAAKSFEQDHSTFGFMRALVGAVGGHPDGAGRAQR